MRTFNSLFLFSLSKLSQKSKPAVLFRRSSDCSQAVPLSWRRFASNAMHLNEGTDRNVGENFSHKLKDSQVSVRAFCISESVDLNSLVALNRQNLIPHPSGTTTTNQVVLVFGSLKPQANGLGAYISAIDCRYVIVFRYGSLVMFNVNDQEVTEYLKMVEKHALGLLPNDEKREYEVRVKPTLNTWLQGGLDHVMLQDLNFDGIRTIGCVLGRRIDIDYCVRKVDQLIAELNDLSLGMKKHGTITMKKKELMQLSGKALSITNKIVNKMELSARSDKTLRGDRNAQIQNYLLNEFNLAQDSATLYTKLDFVQSSAVGIQATIKNSGSNFNFLGWFNVIFGAINILAWFLEKKP